MGFFDFIKRSNGDTELNITPPLMIPTSTLNFYGPRYKFLFMPYKKLTTLMRTDVSAYQQETYRYIRSVVHKWIVLKKNGKYLFFESDGRLSLKDNMAHFIDARWLSQKDAFSTYLKRSFNINLYEYQIEEVSSSTVLRILGAHGF